jgi:hypothetical protein
MAGHWRDCRWAAQLLQRRAGNCAHAGTIAVTMLAGPLNYVGVNPKVSCQVPQPSQ